MIKIYTKTGDHGETSLYGGKRISKSSAVVTVLGSIDELNALLGTLDFPLTDIQEDLMTIAAFIAGSKQKIPGTKKLERAIDKMQADLPPLQNFILPKGPIHYARTICRRCERDVVSLSLSPMPVVQYLNRLSDYLFVLARWINFKSNTPEVLWKSST